ncbi:MAG TPA: YciI family protein [Bdellovibrionota bacterium]|nr:YciI family protein [Bdellovibrionota bacterium]
MEDPGFTRYVILLEKVPGRELTRATIDAHIAHLARLDDEKKLVLSGPFADHPSGMVVVQAESKDEAVAIAEADPFVREGVRTYEVRTWLLACRENGYLG